MRLLTKESRLKVQAADFESLQAQGYMREDYKGLIFWTRTDTTGRSGQILYTLKAYKVNAAHALDFRNYRSEERRAQVIEQYKANHDRREAYKAEVKAQGKPQSNQAQAAQAIREELKANFKGIKFSVTSEGYSMGDHVNVSWQDGPTSDQVEAITGKYQAGHFNGMEDIYEYDKNPANVPQTKYLFCTRSMSEATKAVISENMLQIMPGESWEEQQARERETRKIWNRSPLPTGATVTGIDRGDEANRWEERLIYTAPETQATTAPVYEPQEVKAGEIQIIQHPTRAHKILIIGDTKPIKEKIKGLGGWWDRINIGWEFKAAELERISKALTPEPHTIAALPEETQKTISQDIDFITNVLTPDPETIQDEPTAEEAEAIAEETRTPLQLEEHTAKKYDNLEEIEQAANNGEIIDLTNLYELVNSNKPTAEAMREGAEALQAEAEKPHAEEVKEKLRATANKLQEMATEHRAAMEIKRAEIQQEANKFFEELDSRHPLNICDRDSSQYKEALREYKTTEEQRKENDQRRAGRVNTALPAPQMFLSF